MQYLSKRVIAEQTELYSHSNQRLSEKRIHFDDNDDIFDIVAVKVSDSNYQAEVLHLNNQKYLKVKEISWISKIIKSKMMFMRTLFKLIYSRKDDLNEFHLSRKFELWEMLLRMKEKNSVICVNTTYKQKMNKIQSVNLERMMNKTLNKLANW